MDDGDERQGPWEDDHEDKPLDEEEREALRRDLVDVQVLKSLLSPRGIKGTVFYCPDCAEDHYLAWDLLTNNLQELLREGESPVHEPAFNPDPDDYVSWDYASGFADGYQSYLGEEAGEVAARLVVELDGRRWSPEEIAQLLDRIGMHDLVRRGDEDEDAD